MRLLIAALRRVIAESYQIGTVYDYDAVVKSAQRFGNPDIVSHGSGSCGWKMVQNTTTTANWLVGTNSMLSGLRTNTRLVLRLTRLL